MTAQEAASYIYKELIKAGATHEGACAILGNIEAESRFIPNNVQDSSGLVDSTYTEQVDNGLYTNFIFDSIGYGLAQWTYHTRKKKFLEFMVARGSSIGDFENQVIFLIKEFKEDFATIWKQVCSENDLYNLTSVLLNKWENPKVKNLSERYSYALKWQGKFTKGGEVKVTQKEAIEKVLDLAREEIGYHEKLTNSQLDDKYANAGGGNFTKYGRDLDAVTNFYNGKKNGFAWCDQFVDWLFYKSFGAQAAMQMLCQPQRSAGAGCLYSAQYYKSAGCWYTTPQPGDQIFFYSSGSINHTGIVEKVEGAQVITIEGNTADQVARRTYALANGLIAGYGRPRWQYASSVPDTPTPAPAPSTIILRYGSKGAAVKSLQEKLIKLGYDLSPDGADGDFGMKTLAAVRKFQYEHGLTADGEVGPQTEKVLDNALSVKTTVVTAATSTISVGDIVMFTGTKNYLSANSSAGVVCRPGKARVTMIYNFANVKHPYHLIKIAGGGSTVFGWVDAADVKKI